MNRDNFIKNIEFWVQEYIENFDRFDSNPQIRINPQNHDVALVNGSDLLSEIEDSNEAVEDAAGAQGMETQDASDYQVKQNPDFYPVKTLLKPIAPGKSEPDHAAIAKIANKYYR